MELYKKYRPESLKGIIGNEDTVEALRNMLSRQTLPHVLLFHGPAGCGKTTMARILRRELEVNEIDSQEVNSGSFRGIDTMRDVARNMALAPAASSCRMWIFDEVHKWTNDAQNASLKILEDTPRHVYFVLCTTDPQKLLKAVLSRCCEMPVRLLSHDELTKLVKRVCKRENVLLSRDVLDELVSVAQGSPRSALVLLDKICNLPENQQLKAMQRWLAEEEEAIDLCRALIKKAPWKKVAGILKNLRGDVERVRWAVLGYARTVLISTGDHQAYLVIDCFRSPFYDSKEAGLTAACYEAIHGS